ncbi:MAG: prephenate dehydrogenase [Lachnospiraceae bacterium]|jgi:prephenate dehydrogenase|nr:prephenate dehydrogenase [Lachnospiraceae bacterium]
MMNDLCIGFLGFGLIGGSIARALKSKSRKTHICVYDISQETLQEALADQIADEIFSEWNETFPKCDFVFLCAPVEDNSGLLKMAEQGCAQDGIITDVGSTKAGIHRMVRDLGLSASFIGGHPMAGSERCGYRNSKANLLENAYYMLTPEPGVEPSKIERYRELVESIGAIPLILTPEKHDFATAAISHLPHVIAASLVNLVQKAATETKDNLFQRIAAGGFKDLTRIASSDPRLWQQICTSNQRNLIELLQQYQAMLNEFIEVLQTNEETLLTQYFQSAKSYRDQLPFTNAGFHADYTIKVDIADEPGALATIATILALRQLSIKNMEITHNREWEEGVLAIAFYAEESQREAVSILRQRGYTVYEIS